MKKYKSIIEIGESARKASKLLAIASSEQKNLALLKMSEHIGLSANKILEENNWKDVEILCYDDSLLELFSNKSELIVSKTNLNSKFFLTTCEFLIAKDGSLLICAEQIKSHKVSDLPQNFIVFAKISQFTETLSLGLNGIKSKYPQNLPTNITTIKNFNSDENENTNFLTYGSSAKNLYLLLLEDL